VRFFLKCYRTDKLTGPILINLDRVRWIELSAHRECSVVALDGYDSNRGRLSEVFFEGRPEDVAAHVISVIGV
jgi:hypothetical protein